jgi:hypothetical protein
MCNDEELDAATKVRAGGGWLQQTQHPQQTRAVCSSTHLATCAIIHPRLQAHRCAYRQPHSLVPLIL